MGSVLFQTNSSDSHLNGLFSPQVLRSIWGDTHSLGHTYNLGQAQVFKIHWKVKIAHSFKSRGPHDDCHWELLVT